jgi:pimeloyl-ACP methyl ester carboxylesterase
MRAPRSLLASLLLPLLPFACSSGPDPGLAASSTGTGGSSSSATTTVGAGGSGGAGTGGSGASFPTVDLVWEPCPLHSDGTGPMAECAKPAVPLRAADPGGKQIPAFVKRFAKAGSARSKQLWMLAGGPGASGMLYERRAELLVEDDDTLEIYMPDHRGTGSSARLGCPKQESDGSTYGHYLAPTEWAKCVEAVKAQWGADLDAFTVSAASIDLGILVESARRPEAKVFVYGASYGTFWAHRYLQLFPHQADGVILDAIAPPTASLARQDLDADASSADLFQACIDDPTCGPKLGGDPRGFALALYAQLDQGHCPALGKFGPPRVMLRRTFGQMMMTWNARRLIPAAIARATRCNADDVSALLTLEESTLVASPLLDDLLRKWGFVLSSYVTFSELWETPEVSTAQMAAWRDAAVVSRDVTSQFDAPLAVLPRYPHDAYYGGFADTDQPLLMLQGTWDPATRPVPAAALAKAYTGAAQHWVEIPRGAHGALQSVPMLDGRSCGTLLVLGFLADPKGPLDTSCLTQLAPLTFDGTPALNTLLFGTEDAWGGL